MLQLKGITKVYEIGDTKVHALRGVDLTFRKTEFVSILGPSGCGKTTMLNIVGGLDQYTEGDLIINDTSTKKFNDKDWDAYRNNSVGFVFQSYNLIPHQSVISNVELALTLSGVSKTERNERAKAVLARVGLSDQLNKSPNQLSGGQMQRVAIARALVNDPDILLADEPTGALDSETSIQVMDLLKEISEEKLVIMVTHNPELADAYSNRIIKLVDGRILSDSHPAEESVKSGSDNFTPKRTSMGFFTALALSFNNMLTKKGRTLLTAVAGSIGIIGIALILSLSNGMQTYIAKTERDTLSSYPITIEHETMDLTSMIQSLQGKGDFEEHALDKVYANTVMAKMINTLMSEVRSNDLATFKKYIEDNKAEIDGYTTAVSYTYSVPLNLYHTNGDGKLDQVNPNTLFSQFSPSASADSSGMSGFAGGGSAFSTMNNMDMWRPLIPNRTFLEGQYEIVSGKLPDAYNEAILVITEKNEVPDLLLYSLGLRTKEQFETMMEGMFKGDPIDDTVQSFGYDEIIGLEYPLILPTDVYKKDGNAWIDQSEDETFMNHLASTAEKVKIVGIVRPNPDAASVSADVFIGYTTELMEYVISNVASSPIATQQVNNPDTDVFTGQSFEPSSEPMFKTMDDIFAYIDSLPAEESASTLAQIQQAQAANVPPDMLLTMMNDMAEALKTDATYEGNIALLGITDKDHPSSINIYASSFENKDLVADFISEYNESAEEGGEITYTDFVGLLMSSITTIINAISIVLIAFVSISLVVSSIMIGIITYISVLERTREIGVLRAIGASKRDIARVFNAETLIIGFFAGALGIVVTALLCIPANAIVLKLTDIANVAILPMYGAVALILISMFLTFIAGLFPSNMAAKKDPVVALRSE
jgi:putative ABC transport system permease protein